MEKFDMKKRAAKVREVFDIAENQFLAAQDEVVTYFGDSVDPIREAFYKTALNFVYNNVEDLSKKVDDGEQLEIVLEVGFTSLYDGNDYNANFAMGHNRDIWFSSEEQKKKFSGYNLQDIVVNEENDLKFNFIISTVAEVEKINAKRGVTLDSITQEDK